MTTPDIAQRLRANAAAWLPTNDHTLEAHNLLELAAAELERLRAQVADAERTARNRDMWKGQCERQAARLERLHAVSRLALRAADTYGASVELFAVVNDKLRSVMDAAPAQQAEPVADDEEGDTFHGRTGIAVGLQQAEPTEFTDWGRAAVAWVLWHHQGGSSAIGQPLRFALGLSAHERLPAHFVASAQEWAKSVGASTEEFHRQKASQPSAQGVTFDADGFRAWVRANLPDDTIIGSSAYWANHLTAWAGRFVKAAAQAPAAEPRTDEVFSYSGRIYVRPCGRGISLEDKPNDFPQLEDALPEGHLVADISIRRPVA